MAFTENTQHGCVYMTSDKISARHMFTTRIGGVSKGVFASWNLGVNRGDDDAALRENYRLAGEIIGCNADDFVVTKQVHGRIVYLATESDRYHVGSDKQIECDGFVTNVRGLPLMIYIADCVPVLLHDPEAYVAAAVHCGWKSSVQDILGAAVEKMCALGAKPQSIRAAIGASIGKCCFECDDDVPAAVERYLGGETEGLFEKSPTGKRMSTFAERMREDFCSSASRGIISTCRMNARCAFRINTGRTERPTASAAAWRRQ